MRGKAKITMPMGPVSGEGFLLGLQMATPCCVFTWPFGGVQVEREEASSWVSLFSQGNKSHHECSILTTSSKPPKDPQLQIPIRLGLQHVNFKYDTIRSIALAFRTSHPFCIKDALIPRKQPSSLKLFLHHL